MALNAQALVTAEEAETFLQISGNASYDVALEYVINGVSAEFSRYAKRSFITTVYTALELTGESQPRLWLPNWPVTLLSSVVEDGTTLTVDEDFHLDAENGVLEKAWDYFPSVSRLGELGTYQGVWTPKANAIVVTYTAGYARTDLPGDLKLAALIEISRQFKRFLTREHGDTSRSVESASVTVATPDEPEWMSVVSRYRRLRI